MLQPPITRILVATDLSGPADAALRYAGRLAELLNAELHVLHVVDNPLGVGWTSEVDAARLPEVQQAMEIEARENVARVLPQFDSAFPGRLVLRLGDAVQEILTYSDTEAVDLVVVGSRGRSGLERLLMGSVAEQVVRNSRQSVLVVRG